MLEKAAYRKWEETEEEEDELDRDENEDDNYSIWT